MHIGQRTATLLIAAVAVLGLTGCSPEPDPYFALRMTDGKPTLLIAECALTRIDYISIWEHGRTGASGTASPEWQVDSPLRPIPSTTIKTSAVDAPAQVTLLEVPPGWFTQKDTLRELRDGTEYYLSGGLANVGSLSFTLAQLNALAPGDVLTSFRKKQVVTEQTWREKACS
ncbi:hypothetical protein [Actinoplanes regularis]|uniref:hypothetical protein n=1 Tax=Actinoplanes regularis TaxID=52697 RepID=UPI0024A5590E|nr:hypothetical protein [Actinoplanes regularis]GLW34868.1 hypothetical protein Areg01_78040 [Actinoplanes regularis]